MGETTGITWTDHTFNPWWGCIKVSPGCEKCYAETFTHRMGLNLWGPHQRRFFGEKHWNEPQKWNAAAEKEGGRKRVFCASMADVFEKFEGLDEHRARLWELIDRTPYLEWLILTKRPENIEAMMPKAWIKSPPDWIRIGVTVEDQPHLNRVITLLQAWRGKNFVSYEPALSLVHFLPFLVESPEDCSAYCPPDACIQWVICGGESGAGCRPMDLEWARSVRDQCKQAGVPFFMKQLGGFPDKRHVPAEWPEDLRIQEFPK
jgi:protein gp37